MSCLLNIYPVGTGASLSILVQILVGLAATYLVATVSESCQHRFVGHASIRTRRFWARNPRLCAHLLRAYYGHAVVHHGLTFRKNHVTQFVSVEEKAAVDRITERAADERIRAERYGLTVGLPAFVTYNLTVFPIVPVVVILAGPWATAGALPVLVVTPLLSMLIHPYIHREHEAATREAPAVVAFLLKTRYFQAVSRHHYLHHKYRDCNFNLLLGGDFLLGKYRKAGVQDLGEIAAIGLGGGGTRQSGAQPGRLS
jgi:hypothetical protein